MLQAGLRMINAGTYLLVPDVCSSRLSTSALTLVGKMASESQGRSTGDEALESIMPGAYVTTAAGHLRKQLQRVDGFCAIQVAQAILEQENSQSRAA